jgi:hypothetical protein
MSKTKKEKVIIVTIPEDKSASLEIGGLFYQRLNKLLIDYSDSVEQKKLIHSILLIQRDKVKPEDTYTVNLETLIILLRDVEKAFQEAGHAVDNELEIDVPKDFKEMNAFAQQFAEATKKS